MNVRSRISHEGTRPPSEGRRLPLWPRVKQMCILKQKSCSMLRRHPLPGSANAKIINDKKMVFKTTKNTEILIEIYTTR